MTHIDGKGMNILEENIKRLKELFPEIVTEGKVNFDMLRQVLGDYVEEDKEAYSFTWSGKGKALRYSQTPSTGTLRPAKKESKDWDITQNLYIEGDNFEVLNIFQKSYFGLIKAIYIDPPYNTGNDFVYDDKFQDSIKYYKEVTGQLDSEGNVTTTNPETSGRYHRDWLNMMYPRLRIARKLLRDDGVIFISIDDSEVANLRKLCDEVFGETNFIAQAVRRRRLSQANLAKNISPIHEYLIIYAKKQGDVLNKVKANIDESAYRNPDNDPRGPYVTMPCTNKGGAVYSVVTPTGREITEEWRFTMDTYNRLFDDNRIVFPRDGEGKPRYKLFLEEKRTEGVLSNTWLDDVSSNQEATREIVSIFDGVVFDTPKPVGLLRHVIELGTEKDSIVLDFFSGSATTAHAIMQANAEDGGNRRFIMIQLPEITDAKSEAYKAGYKNISEIGKERIRRAGELVKKQAIESWNAADMEQRQQMKNPDELDIGFKVFKLDSTNLIKWNPDRENLEDSLLGYVDNLEDGRSEEDLLYEVMLKMGADLTWPIETHKVGTQTIYSVGFGALMVCLSDRITTEVADAMARLKEQLKPETWKVVFKDSGFADDMAKTNIKETLKCAGLPEDAFTTL